MDQAKKLREIMENKKNLSKNNKNIEIENIEGEVKKAKVLSVSSGKGGVGKTNFSINYSIALRELGNKVLILDADIGLSNVEILSGADIKYNISDLIFSNKKIEDVLSEGPKGVKIISGGSGLKELALFDKANFPKIISFLNELQLLFDYIIIDTGAGISSSVIDFILASDEVIIISTPDPTSVMDAYVLIKSLSIKNYSGQINVVSNFVRNSAEGFHIFNKLDNAAKEFLKFKINYLGYMLEDKLVNTSVRNQLPFIVSNPNRKISKQIFHMANTTIQENEFKKEQLESKSFGQRIINLFFGE